MSRRKQAKPRSFKPEVDTDSCDENLSANVSPYEPALLDNHDASVGDLAEIDYSSPLSQSNLLVRIDTNDSLESDDQGTDQETSWFSATPENSQASPVPSSCATPNSISDLPDAELSFTVGITENTQYGCSFCDKAFPRLSFLKKHEQIHSDQMPFRCEFCSRLFKHKRSRDRHVKLHTGDKKYRCLHCVAAFSRSDHLKIHMKTHDTEKPFKCKICSRGYNTAAALTSHIQNHKKQKMESSSGCGSTGQESSTANTSDEHTSSPENFPCKHCGECFQNMEYLQSHLSSNHLSDLNDRTSKLVTNLLNLTEPVQEMPPITTKLACIYCTKDIFNTMEQLQNHVQLMHRSILNGEMCDYTFNDINNKYPTHELQNSRAPNSLHENYTCDICNIQFNSVQRLHKHNLIVHRNYIESLNQPNYMCIKCTVPFQSSHMFTEHYLRVHENSLNDLFLMSPLLEQDINKFSRKAKRQCLERVDAKVNQYEHTGTLLCNQCDAALPNFESFRSHLKTHLEQAGIKNDSNNIFDEKINSYTCPYCTISFKELDDYEQHALSHFLATTVEYECKCCTKSFATSDELQAHLMDRHADHIYRCSLCKEMFDSKVAIQVHFAVKHSTGSKFYRCVACPYDSVLFNSKLEFSLHVKTIHGSQNPVITNNKSIRCMFCRQRFNTDIEMQFHLTSHSKQFHCPVCPEKFQIEFLLDRHMEMCHSNSQIINNKNVSLEEKSNKSDISSNTPALHSPSTPKMPKNNNENNNKKPFDIFDCEVFDRTDFSNDESHSNNNQNKKQTKHSNVSLHCAYCGENCKSRTDIENHLKHHSQGGGGGSLGKYKCNICDELCSSAIFLAEHKLTHCKIISGNNCTHCKTTLTNKEQFYMHLIQHSNNNNNNQAYKSQVVLPTPCVICRQTLMSEVEVKIHSQYHLNNTLQQYECSLCLKLTENKNIIVSNSNSYVCKDCFSSTGLLDYTFRCSSCGIICSKKLTNDSKTCVKCQNNESEKDSNQDNTHECYLCRRLFSKPLELQAHLIEHTFAGCGSYTCYLCSAVFTAAHGLQNHILEHGLAARPYDCPKCNIKFFFRAELDNHNYTHLNDNENLNEDEKFFNSQEECVSPAEQKVNCKNLNFIENFKDDVFIKQEPEENNENIENGN